MRNGSLALSDLGGRATHELYTLNFQVDIAAHQCERISVNLYNPAPRRILGSMVVGTITDADGNAVVDNNGTILPTLITGTSQGGAIAALEVCAGGSAQSVPAGSKIRWSLLRP